MLPKKYRLIHKKDFDALKKKGTFFHASSLGLVVSENSLGDPRFGFIVSSKISKKATVRNRIKRVLREKVRRQLLSFEDGCDFLFVAKKNILEKKNEDILEEIKSLVSKFQSASANHEGKSS